MPNNSWEKAITHNRPTEGPLSPWDIIERTPPPPPPNPGYYCNKREKVGSQTGFCAAIFSSRPSLSLNLCHDASHNSDVAYFFLTAQNYSPVFVFLEFQTVFVPPSHEIVHEKVQELLRHMSCVRLVAKPPQLTRALSWRSGQCAHAQHRWEE